MVGEHIIETENAEYLSEQLITYLGNKRLLLDFIGDAVDIVKKRLNADKLRFFDVFSGSGIVARYFKKNASYLIANDLELYSYMINTCYLSNAADRDMVELRGFFCDLKDHLEDCEFDGNWKYGILSESYAPQNDSNIKKGERVFYTRRNAAYIDTARSFIDTYPQRLHPYFISPLMAEASVHANTAGVFKGFYKNRETGIGEFGGKNRDALSRIIGNINLSFPLFSNYDCDVSIHRRDANELAYEVPEVDLAYLDPPYNQHPYGSNYFMLNIIAENKKPHNISPVSGIPADWNRSVYNKGKEAQKALIELIDALKAKFVLLSFNSEGFISKDALVNILKSKGNLQVFESPYNTFRASRNLKNRNTHVTEYLFLLEKK
ncbi:DNA adenine methylase [Treponema sp. OMZ 840]|uniref:DNA adenine methylase n=1 Tax=Treponema sp. OMZ 840 TaxID=244313 RepID=UPI003D8D268C